MDEIETTEVEGFEPEVSGAPASEDVASNDAPAENSAEKDADSQAEEMLASEDNPLDGEALAFKPNVKFKVLDKEMEIPKEFQSLMKDAASEKIVRELFEKAEGLPTVKQKLETVRGENVNLSRENGDFKQTVESLRSIYNKAVSTGNYHKLDDWLKILEVPQDVMINYALAKVKLAELPPDQRQMLMGQMDAERNAETQQQQNARLQQDYARVASESKTLQLDSQLQNVEYKTAADLFDSRVGKPGSFKEEVRRAGQLAWHTERVDLSPQQAIDRVIANYGLKASGIPAAMTAQAPGASGSTAAVMAKKPASTIPNISGGSKSPVQTSKVRNLDDLKKLRDQAWSS